VILVRTARAAWQDRQASSAPTEAASSADASEHPGTGA
jgi:hypothetical protein